MPRKIDLQDKIARLREFHRVEDRVPGYAEMLEILGYRSKNAVYGLLRKLEELGYVRKGRGGKLAFTRQLTGTIKILGAVAAGFPAPAEEQHADVTSLDEYLVKRPDATFMLTVTGDSMIDAGIQPGDVVLVERGAPPRSGQIVVAQVDGEWTLKYYLKEHGEVRLEPANRKYQPIRPRQSLAMGGIVRAVVRKYD